MPNSNYGCKECSWHFALVINKNKMETMLKSVSDNDTRNKIAMTSGKQFIACVLDIFNCCISQADKFLSNGFQWRLPFVLLLSQYLYWLNQFHPYELLSTSTEGWSLDELIDFCFFSMEFAMHNAHLFLKLYT